MKLIDEKGRLFGKINVVDLCVVLAVIVAIGVFFVKGNPDKVNTSNANSTVTYTVEIKAIREMSVNALKANADKSITENTEEKKNLGVISDISVKTATGYIASKKGELVKSEYPDKYDVTLTIETTGLENEKGVYTESGKQLLIGEYISFIAEDVQTSGEITAIGVK